MNNPCRSLLLLILLICIGSYNKMFGETKTFRGSGHKLVFALCVNNNADAAKAELLLESLNRFGGDYSNSRVYVVFKDSSKIGLEILKKYNTEFLPLKIDPSAINYPFAYKPYACAEVEAIAAEQNCDLVWLDNECLILSQPDELVLCSDKESAFRPVFLLNSVGQDPFAVPDIFGSRIYSESGVDYKTVPVMETFIKGNKIRFYINCQVITVNPKLGIFREWEKIFTKLLNDSEYQTTACPDQLHKIFLHQAVLSAVLLSKIKPEEFQIFSNNYGYPIHLQEIIPPGKRLSVNDVKVLLYENIFSINPDWLNEYNVKESLKSWIIHTRREVK